MRSEPLVQEFTTSTNNKLVIETIELPDKPQVNSLRCIWLPGWENQGRLGEILHSFFTTQTHYLIDLPGFGDAPAPGDAWGSEAYAEALHEWLQQQPSMPTVFIGHSFGCRVALQLAKRFPAQVNGLVLTAAAGLKRRRPWWWYVRVYAYKCLAQCVRVVDQVFSSKLLERLRRLMGSKDYQSAGSMRATLVRVVNEDLSGVAASVPQPTLLLFGENDTETPVSFGQRLQAIMPAATLQVLPNFDHWNILQSGRHQVIHQLQKFFEILITQEQR